MNLRMKVFNTHVVELVADAAAGERQRAGHIPRQARQLLLVELLAGVQSEAADVVERQGRDLPVVGVGGYGEEVERRVLSHL